MLFLRIQVRCRTQWSRCLHSIHMLIRTYNKKALKRRLTHIIITFQTKQTCSTTNARVERFITCSTTTTTAMMTISTTKTTVSKWFFKHRKIYCYHLVVFYFIIIFWTVVNPIVFHLTVKKEDEEREREKIWKKNDRCNNIVTNYIMGVKGARHILFGARWSSQYVDTNTRQCKSG